MVYRIWAACGKTAPQYGGSFITTNADNGDAAFPLGGRNSGDCIMQHRSAPFPFLCFWFLLYCDKRNALLFFPWKRNSLSFLLEEMPVSSCFPKQRIRLLLFSKAKMVLCCAKYTYPKSFLDSSAIRRGEAGVPAFLLCSFAQTFCLHRTWGTAVPFCWLAMSCLGYLPYSRVCAYFISPRCLR